VQAEKIQKSLCTTCMTERLTAQSESNNRAEMKVTSAPGGGGGRGAQHHQEGQGQ
jgi:hypothetical protein